MELHPSGRDDRWVPATACRRENDACADGGDCWWKYPGVCGREVGEDGRWRIPEVLVCVQEFYVEVENRKIIMLSIVSQQPYSLADRLCTMEERRNPSWRPLPRMMDGLSGSTEWFVQRRSDGEYGCWRPFINNKFFTYPKVYFLVYEVFYLLHLLHGFLLLSRWSGEFWLQVILQKNLHQP